MRPAFTLIEVLVTLVLLTLIMGVIMPVGSKMLDQFSQILDQAEGNVEQQLIRMKAFSSAEDIDVLFEGKRYTYKANGVVLIHD